MPRGKKSSPNRGGRGRGGRGRGGRGRGGRGRGAEAPVSTPPTPTISSAAIATTSAFDDALAMTRKNLQATKKLVNRLPAEKRDELKARKREKELEFGLLPDAPPSKRRRQSPVRVPCRLVPGTPEVPPPRKPQLWEMETTVEVRAEEDGTESVASESESTSTVPSLLVDWTTGALKKDNDNWVLLVPPKEDTTDDDTDPASAACGAVPTPPQENLTDDDTDPASAACGAVPTPPQENLTDDDTDPASAACGAVPTPPQENLTDDDTDPASAACGAVPTPPQENLTDDDTDPASAACGAVPTPPQENLTDDEPIPSCSFEPQAWRSSAGAAADVSTASGQHIISDWLNRCYEAGSDEDDGDVAMVPEGIAGDVDFINESPAILPNNVDNIGETWLDNEDVAADHVVRGLLCAQEDQLIFDWSHSPDTFLGQREVFRGQPGPTFLVEASTTPLEVFSKYFDSELLDLIVSETNRNISSIQQPLQQQSRFKNIKPTSRQEIAVFLAMLIFQGLCPLTVERDYFRENGFLTLKYFKTLMSFNRFVVLKRLLHFADNEASTDTMTSDDFKLRKLGPLLSLLNRRFSELYRPSRDIAIDESLMKWHGRLSFAQKIATKAAKVGVKSYELCESSSGYLWKFFIYTGKGQNHGQKDDDDNHAPKNATAQIVIDLVRPLLNLGHTLTMDNFYNSPLLARYLKSNGTDCMGTLRVNREFVPETIKNTAKRDLRPGEYVHSYCRDISVLLWRDQNVVSMISTFHGGEIGGKEKYGVYKYKPQVVIDYNQSMGGVDRKDQLLSAFPMERSRNTAWYKKVFRRLLNVTILNAYIVLKTKQPRLLQREFRTRLANELVQKYHPSVPHPLPAQNQVATETVIHSVTNKPSRPILTGNHFVGKGDSRSKTCVWCRKARSAYKCEECNVALCLFGCFKDYHTKEDK